MKSKIVWQWHNFEDLSPRQMQAMFALRQNIFIIEQNCPYPDIDGKDEQAFHLLAWSDNQLVGTLRVFESYPEYQNRASIGRICTHESIRKEGLGRVLVAKALEFIEQKLSKTSVQISAQYYLKGFYQGFGFEQISAIYQEDGIDHILMLRLPLG